ncbi:MAG: hypothetical protein C0606_02055 [Hyphomicrobiales bacterium]|nr:MAG: hypothetical protein C0606_02055 [Hyphomicrobiales bacterium]
MATYTVTTNLDEVIGGSYAADKADGDGLSLREAIHWANQASGADTVNFDASLAGTTLVLTQGQQIYIYDDITIDGDVNGDDKADITISGDADQNGTLDVNDDRIFNVASSSSATFNSLTLDGGYASSFGGLIFGATGTTITVNDSTLTNGTAYGKGGAIGSVGTINVTNSLISDSTGSYGGAISVGTNQTATIVQSTFTGNTATNDGGAIQAGYNSTVSIDNSTIVGNNAQGGGGGIDFYNAAVTINSTVISTNTATGSGANIGKSGAGGTLTVGTSFMGTQVQTDGLASTSGGNAFGNDPGLGLLADNGGTTQTFMPDFDSPLVNEGSNGQSLTNDANGNSRVVMGDAAIGASEFQLVVTTADDEARGTSFADDVNDGDGLSLREALWWAGTGDTITFDASLKGSTITLGGGSSGYLSITTDMTIDGDVDGDDKADITISGDSNGNSIADNGDARIFNISNSGTDVTLESLNITNGFSSASGGAILVGPGTTLNLVNSTVSNSAASSNGGAISNLGTLNITNSLLTGNSAGSSGGAIYVSNDDSLSLENTTIHGNTGAYGSGAIHTMTGVTMDISNSTITGNATTSGSAGGVRIGGNGTVTIANSVIAENSATFGANDDLIEGGTNTVAVHNSAFSSLSGLSFDIDVNNTASATLGLGALQDNGGPVMTRALDAGSVLINAGNNSFVSGGNTTDANGNDRITAGTVDIGATEFGLVVDTTSDTGNDGTVDGLLAVDANDGGGLSLREAIAHAEDGDLITFDASLLGSTITLANGQISMTQDIEIDGDIDGDDKADITISGGGAGRILDIDSAADATIRSLTLTQGDASGDGGAIRTANGSGLTLIDSTVSDSTASADGGGIFAAGALTLVNSTISGNEAGVEGGGLVVGDDTEILGSTIYGNTAGKAGGGIDVRSYYPSYQSVTIRNSTIAGNVVTATDHSGYGGYGGGIRLYSYADISITNSIVANNTALAESDIGHNSLAPGFGSHYVTIGNSFIGTALPSVGIDRTDDLGGNTLNGGDAMLGELLDNGGTVLTLSPLDGSPVIGMGSDTLLRADQFDVDGDGVTNELLPQDGRGAARIVGILDAGAVERVEDEDIGGTAAANTIAGGAGFDTLTGYGGNDTLEGGADDDTLNGGDDNDSLDGGSGADSMSGGAGDDTYVVDDAGDVVSEAGGSGNDLVKSSIDYILGGGLENLSLLGSGSLSGTGTNAANAITGNSGNNTLSGLGGDDTLDGADGNDTLDGGNGADSMSGGNGKDELNGGAHDDTLNGGADSDTLDGGNGADSMLGGNGDDTYIVDNAGDVVSEAGGSGHDLVKSAVDFILGGGLEDLTLLGAGNRSGTGTNTANTITGNNGANALSGLGGDDTLIGLGGNDTLDGANGNDSMSGGNGNDELNGGANDDTLDGGGGNDTAVFNGSGKITVDLQKTGGQNTGQGTDRLINIENVTSGNGNDQLTGTGAGNTLIGNGGNDTLIGLNGNDILEGGNGNDELNGGNQNDTLNGGGGNDTVLFTGTGRVTVDLRTTASQNTGQGSDKLLNIENVTSGGGNDKLTGNGGGNTLIGNNGNDALFGLGAQDVLRGGGGNDTLNGGTQHDTLDGGGGVDTAIFSGNGKITVDLRKTGIQNTGQGNDKLLNIENVTSGGGNDKLTGKGNNNVLNSNNGHDTLSGLDGKDTLLGGGGNDKLFGGNQNDVLKGGAGADTLRGDAGNDQLYGQGGPDTFVFDDGFGKDRILDYNDNADTIDLRPYSGLANFGDLTIRSNANGDAVIDLGTDEITLVGVNKSVLDASDFLI